MVFVWNESEGWGIIRVRGEGEVHHIMLLFVGYENGG